MQNLYGKYLRCLTLQPGVTGKLPRARPQGPKARHREFQIIAKIKGFARCRVLATVSQLAIKNAGPSTSYYFALTTCEAAPPT